MRLLGYDSSPMRLLLDESVPARLRHSLKAQEVKTVGEMGWSGIKNGEFLMLAAVDFDAFITVDKNLQYQQTSRRCLCLWCSWTRTRTSFLFRSNSYRILSRRCLRSNQKAMFASRVGHNSRMNADPRPLRAAGGLCGTLGGM